ncbi:MAG: glycosyltransferase family 4 protein [Syntrophales bacterium]|nr:glycosyltransferase family 4 protein [Syntrophales bacterium]
MKVWCNVKNPDIDRLKIALLHYSCPHVVGGVEEVIGQQASLFHRHGHEVKIIAGKGDVFTEEFPVIINPLFSSTNTFVNRAQQELINGKRLHFDDLIENIFVELKSELESFDFLIAHNVMTMPYNLPLIFAIKKLADYEKVKVISWNHDSCYFFPDCPDVYHSEPWDILKTKIPSIHYVCISEVRSKQFRELYKTKEKITAIPDGIDPPEFFQLAPDLKKIVREQKLYEADLIMVHPSRLIPRKNFELGLKVVYALKKKGVNVRYLITGVYDPHEPKNLKYYRELKKIIKDFNITREVLIIADYPMKNGKKIIPDNTFIRDLYFIADILFMPSISEGFGLPLLEAGMAKLPIVCSDIPSFMEIGRDYVCSFSITDAPDRIAEKILHFLATISTHNMYRNVIEKYAWDAVYRNHIRPLFKKAMKARRGKV